ncbi:transglutaminase domain-containing protein [Clostridium sp.]|uniref:transglutaminase domain-containing protein n=1 Tax=Clostridium sp. TaxID=1506 RepID=UPI003F2C930A
MIVIVNGAFGTGKTSVALNLTKSIPDSMLYDPEEVGFMLRNIISDDLKEEKEKTDDFQDLDLWKRFVVKIADELISKYGKNLIVPITLKNSECLEYIKKGFESLDSQVYHFCLTASVETIHKRLIKRGDTPGSFSFNKTLPCIEAFKGLEFEEYVDTEEKTIEEVEKVILGRIQTLSNVFLEEEYLSKREYVLKLPRVDMSILNSAHQRVIHSQKKRNHFEINIETYPLIIQQQLVIDGLNNYLVPTKKIQCNSKEIKNFTRVLIGNEKNKYKAIEKAINFTREIKFDDELALEIFEGGESRGAIETIENKIGTCSECTNVFIAIMRALEIPTKFILGKTSKDVYHTWAEVYIEKIGWIPVETQIHIPIDISRGYFGITNKHIKIYEGIDFEDIGIKLCESSIELKQVF